MDPSKTKPVNAFEGDLDCKPIYLGYSKKEDSYWFYTLKDKIPRFLKFIKYFHWDRGPQEVLEMKPLTEEVELELQQFLEGKFGYEFRKRRKNSKDTTAFKVYRSPDEVFGADPQKDGRNRVKRDLLSAGNSDPGRSLSGPAVVERKDEPDALHGRRRSRGSGHAVHVEHAPSGIVSSPDLASVTPVILPDTLPVTHEPKRRGRPRKIQEASKDSSIVSSDILEVVSPETQNVEPKSKPRKSKSKSENGLVLGSVELLKAFEILLPVEPEVTIRKKRGRPFKVKT